MREIVITLERRGKNALKPVGADRQLVPADSMVTFALADSKIKGTTIEFKGALFPFAQNPVGYGVRLPVKAAFDPSDPHKNIYKFRCRAIGPNGEHLDSDEGGGEMEIVPGG